jgi:hypothetical protein
MSAANALAELSAAIATVANRIRFIFFPFLGHAPNFNLALAALIKAIRRRIN